MVLSQNKLFLHGDMLPYGQSLSEREEGDKTREERSKSNTDSKVIALGGGGAAAAMAIYYHYARSQASGWLVGWLAAPCS